MNRDTVSIAVIKTVITCCTEGCNLKLFFILSTSAKNVIPAIMSSQLLFFNFSSIDWTIVSSFHKHLFIFFVTFECLHHFKLYTWSSERLILLHIVDINVYRLIRQLVPVHKFEFVRVSLYIFILNFFVYFIDLLDDYLVCYICDDCKLRLKRRIEMNSWGVGWF